MPNNGKRPLQTYSQMVFEPADIVELRLIKVGGKPIQQWKKAEELPGQMESLTRLNQQGYNIYAGPNPRREAGKSGDANVLLARCLFCDFDGIEPGDGCGRWEFVLGRIIEAELPEPDMVICSGHGIHTYWKLDEHLKDMDKWRQVQQQMNDALGADTTIKNPERIMRLPGFWNVKKKPFQDTFIIDYRDSTK